MVMVAKPQSSTPHDGGQTEPRKVLLANKGDKSLSQYVCGQTVITVARSEPWFMTPVESSLFFSNCPICDEGDDELSAAICNLGPLEQGLFDAIGTTWRRSGITSSTASSAWHQRSIQSS